MLSFVPTPIGNLGDITFRSLERLSNSEIVLCEDTRVSKQLFNLLSERYSDLFQKREREFISLHHHNQNRVLAQIDLSIFKSEVVYISDAGSPGISDPGVELVNFAIKHNIEFDVLPGATAISVGTLLSGFADRELLFWGFLPHKGKERSSELSTVLNSGYTTLLYESPHRIEKLLNELAEIKPNLHIFVAKELTKKFEKRWWGRAEEIREELKSENLKGEFLVVIKGVERNSSSAITTEDIEALSLPPKEKAKLLSKLTGEKVKEIYNRLISTSS